LHTRRAHVLMASAQGKLAVSFVGQLNDQMAGFYRARYTARDGSQQWGGCTQFEPTDARRAFPCWDEPAHKAVFEITLVIPKDMLVWCPALAALSAL